MNRFSKMVSMNTEVPRRRSAMAIIGACISVGNPGYASVRTWMGSLAFPDSRSPAGVSRRVTPVSSSLKRTARMWSARRPRSKTLPSVMADAHRIVPASIRSGMGRQVHPRRLSQPSTVIAPVPTPVMPTPISCKHMHRSTISGSFAAFSMRVLPDAKAAASRIFSVAPTDGKSR